MAVVEVEEAEAVHLDQECAVLLVTGVQQHGRPDSGAERYRLAMAEHGDVAEAEVAHLPQQLPGAEGRTEHGQRPGKHAQQRPVEVVGVGVRDVQRVIEAGGDRVQQVPVVRKREPGLEESRVKPRVDE